MRNTGLLEPLGALHFHLSHQKDGFYWDVCYADVKELCVPSSRTRPPLIFELFDDSEQLLFAPQVSCISDDVSNENPPDKEPVCCVALGFSVRVHWGIVGEIQELIHRQACQISYQPLQRKRKRKKDKASVL